jgi:putative oxidoreductase
MTRTLVSARAFVVRTAEAVSWVPLALARLSLGFVFTQSGWGKLHDLPKVVAYFGSLGIPAPQIQAPFVAGLELTGGVLLLAGLLTRFASVPLAATMVVALVTAKRDELHGPGDLFGTIEFLYLVVLGLLAASGAGALSLDRLLVRQRKAGEKESVPSR